MTLFARARRRLTLLYIVLFAGAIGLFSAVFFLVMTVVLQPDFDITSDLTGEAAAQRAYQATVSQVGVALFVADVVVIAVIGAIAWVLAARTLAPVRAAHERQRRFVADASHEMRTPLTSIRTTTESALQPDVTRQELDAALVQIGSATDRLARLTADLLLLAQSDDADLRPRREVFDLSVAVAEAVAPGNGGVGHDGSVDLSLTPGLTVSGDPDEVARIVENLVDNAIRYGGDRANVRVVTRVLDRDAVVEVIDHGPGIPLADQDRVFQPFHRVRQDADAPTGTGLGLAIAISLARRNSGRLTLESRPGQGSTFRLHLPRSR